MSELRKPAFPMHPDLRRSVDGSGDWEGMALRDYFAAKALNGLLISRRRSPEVQSFKDVAVQSYEYADAMLKAREQ